MQTRLFREGRAHSSASGASGAGVVGGARHVGFEERLDGTVTFFQQVDFAPTLLIPNVVHEGPHHEDASAVIGGDVFGPGGIGNAARIEPRPFVRDDDGDTLAWFVPAKYLDGFRDVAMVAVDDGVRESFKKRHGDVGFLPRYALGFADAADDLVHGRSDEVRMAGDLESGFEKDARCAGGCFCFIRLRVRRQVSELECSCQVVVHVFPALSDSAKEFGLLDSWVDYC